MSWWGDLVVAVDTMTRGASNTITNPAAQQDQPPSPVAGVTSVLAVIWTNVRDGKLWRSLGWLLLGVLLMLLGAVLLARMSAGELAAGIAKGAL